MWVGDWSRECGWGTGVGTRLGGGWSRDKVGGGAGDWSRDKAGGTGVGSVGGGLE